MSHYSSSRSRSSLRSPPSSSNSNIPGGSHPPRDSNSHVPPFGTVRSFRAGRSRGRGGHRGQGTFGHASYTASGLSGPRPLLDGLGARLQDIDESNFKLTSDEVQIKDVKALGSYNWIDDDSGPTIMVPGSPSVWLDKQPPFAIAPDSDTGAVTSRRLPHARMLPLMIAVEKQTETAGGPPFDWAAQDIVTERNSLRKLISWASNPKQINEFRMDVQLARERTILISRPESSVHYQMPSGWTTYGLNFEEFTTQRRGTLNHHYRVIQYDLNGLKVVVRFEVNGYLQPDQQSNTHSITRKSKEASVENLANALSQVKINPEETIAGLKVVKSGFLVPQSSIIEITTKSRRSKVPMDYEGKYTQLFISNTYHLFTGLHTSGFFEEIRKETLDSPIFREQHQVMQPALKKFRALLAYIQQQVIQCGKRGCLSLVYHDGVLRLYSRTAAHDFLPEEYLGKFDA